MKTSLTNRLCNGIGVVVVVVAVVVVVKAALELVARRRVQIQDVQ
jgi:hypothetical protein